jgi:hypothetical protein
MALRGTVKSSTTSREPHRGQRSRLSKRESGNARPCVHHRAVINSLVVLSRGARTRWGSGAAYYDRLDLLLAQGAIWLGFGILLCGLAVVGYQSFFGSVMVFGPIEIHTIWQMLHRREPKFSNFKWFGFEWVGVRKLIVLFLRARTSSRP